MRIPLDITCLGPITPLPRNYCVAIPEYITTFCAAPNISTFIIIYFYVAYLGWRKGPTRLNKKATLSALVWLLQMASSKSFMRMFKIAGLLHSRVHQTHCPFQMYCFSVFESSSWCERDIHNQSLWKQGIYKPLEVGSRLVVI